MSGVEKTTALGNVPAGRDLGSAAKHQSSVTRAIDLTLALAALLILSPVLVLVALVIKFDSPGQVIFRQTRVGRYFRLFSLYKFRTMVASAAATGPGITRDGDPRITRVGGLLRRWKLDELPQLINVLRGEMSLVGPRPELPPYVELFREDYEELLSVRPGLTDPASLAFRNEESVLARYPDPEEGYLRDVLPEKIRLSKEYLNHASLALDVRLIFKTFSSLVSRSS